jgi:hypothetical protein
LIGKFQTIPIPLLTLPFSTQKEINGGLHALGGDKHLFIFIVELVTTQATHSIVIENDGDIILDPVLGTGQ